MTIQVVGKAHRSGTSKKSGKDYDFTEVHFLTQDRFVEGQACRTLVVDPSIIDPSKILVQQYYGVDFNERGQLLAMQPIKV